MFDPP